MPNTDGKMVLLIDFDGTIHDSDHWSGPTNIDGGPVPEAIDWLAELLADERLEPVIFTTRAALPEGKIAIRDWLLSKGLPYEPVQNMIITNIKIPCDMIIDDRSWRIAGPGSFPTIRQILAFKPWNKERTVG